MTMPGTAICLLVQILSLAQAPPAVPPQPGRDSAARPPADSAVVDPADRRQRQQQLRPSLADELSPWFALALGGFGSAAYLVAVWTGFVGRNKDSRGQLLEHLGDFRWLLYVLSGAGVAMVFQMPESKLVPVQAFILGCTWPAVVANYLSGRQAGDQLSVKEAEDLKRQAAQTDEAKKTAAQLEQQSDGAMKELKDRLAKFGNLAAELGGKDTPPPPGS